MLLEKNFEARVYNKILGKYLYLKQYEYTMPKTTDNKKPHKSNIHEV
ncbi:hypothetical protein BDGL_002735 [Acinetobacter pittii PHEA-2]|uniref:Uncharacterized protein n=1 Tax=Acinetobacter pittii (strain PHEA-2) TaxID=871585 RepID=F0KGQ0_ACIP2|nr:hypothetical protein [Acinetobacter pittii]YP_004997003.1 hypothetical protein BDGL_002735 [Acinetobacter pittii PHEA-2]ADY83321.1 hypothetical protein BDGL_002735 [Acinetobacter pittii PHEA-2]MDX8274109.1 hypothetical protein [Acinetobacter pittii]WPP55173.1 hypothetical protein SOI69_16360 [Acinetobacter pittii]